MKNLGIYDLISLDGRIVNVSSTTLGKPSFDSAWFFPSDALPFYLSRLVILGSGAL